MDPAVVKSMMNSSAGKGVLQLKPMMGTYVWLQNERFLLPTEGHVMISFEARGTNDLHISFNDNCSQIEGREGLRDRSPYYEVVLGGWMNSKTVIRKRGHQQVAIRKEDNPNAVITCKTHFARYWVFFDIGALQIIVGKGAPGTNEIIRWKDVKEVDEETPKLRYFGFSSWNQPIQYRSIILTEGHTALSSLLNLSSLPAPTVFFTQFFNDETLSDITFVVDGERFFGHRFLFHCRARDLYDFLLKDTPEGGNEVKLDLVDEDFHARNFKKLLQFLYCGSLPPQTKRELKSLHKLAVVTRFARLETYCATLLETIKVPLPAPTRPTASSTSTTSSKKSADLNWAEFGDFSSFLGAEAFSDVTFVFPDETSKKGPDKKIKRIPAHRAILAVASEVFYAMLARDNFAESQATEITLHDVPYQSFHKLLECIYSRMPPTFTDICAEVLPLLMVADRFALDNFLIEGKPLHEHCADYIRCNLSVKTCCPTLEVADALNLIELRQTCMNFIETYFEQVALSKSFLRLEACVILEIVLKDTLVVPREEVVYEAIQRWGAYSPEARTEPLKQLLSFVRFPLMDKDYLLNNVLDNECINASEELLNLVNDSINFNRSSANSSDEEDISMGFGYLSPYSSPPVSLSSSPPASSPLRASLSRSNDAIMGLNDFRLRTRASRSFEGWRELTFSGKPGDECGLLYWIGTNHGTIKWQNPHNAKKVLVRCSSPPSRYTQPALLVDRRFLTTSYTSGNPAWYIIDLIDHQLICNYYTLRADGSDSFLRSWHLQASNDGQEWTILRNHLGDTSLNTPGGWGAWPVVTKTPYRYFKIMMTGPNASAVAPRALALSTIEFYGYCKEKD